VTNQFYKTQLPHREDCLSHETYPEPLAVLLGCSSLVSELFHVARSYLTGPLSLGLDRDLVTAIDWPQLGRRVEILRPLTKVGVADSVDPETGQQGRPEIVNAIEEGSPLAG